MKVKCPNCRAEQDLGRNGDDLSDKLYLVQCPVIREHLIKNPGATEINCPHMRDARTAVIRKHRYGV